MKNSPYIYVALTQELYCPLMTETQYYMRINQKQGTFPCFCADEHFKAWWIILISILSCEVSLVSFQNECAV